MAFLLSDSKKHYYRLLNSNDQSVQKLLAVLQDKVQTDGCYMLVHTYRSKARQQCEGDDRYI